MYTLHNMWKVFLCITVCKLYRQYISPVYSFSRMILFATIIFLLGFLIFPLLALLLWRWKKGKEKTWQVVPTVIFFVLLLYARFIEPQIINVYTSTIETSLEAPVKAVLFADPQLGVYKGAGFLQRVVDKINEQNPDIVLIAGDFVYAMPPEDLAKTMRPLSDINAPVFAVLGNHDLPLGENFGSELNVILPTLGVQVMEDKFVRWQTPTGEDLVIVGSKDFWHYTKDEREPIANTEQWRPFWMVHSPKVYKPEAVQPEDIVVWLTHNPDTVHYLNPEWDIDVLMAGHTHGGQIWIPGITKNLIPVKHDFIEGKYRINNTDVFVTAGVGETGLPIRFGVPPRIDVIELR